MRSLALLLTSILLLGCAVPLGPGFSHPSRAVDVSATSNEPTHIHVEVTDSLENAGDRALRFLDVVLPRGPSFGTRNVSVMVGTTATATHVVNRASGPALRISFDPPWPRATKRKITFGYDLEPSPEGRGVVATTADGFYLADPNVFPAWQSPIGPFAKSALRAEMERLEVSVPAGFHVLAVGREQHVDRRGKVEIHRFQSAGAKFPPYLIAGRYQERRINIEHRPVVFWTRESLDEQTTQVVAQRLTASMAVYEASFGPVATKTAPIYVVETSAELAPVVIGNATIPAASFPDGVLFDHRAVTGLATGPVLDVADYELARTWFGWHVRPEPDADLLLGRGMALFAALHVVEAREGIAARREEIARLIATYDQAGPQADEKPGFGPLTAYNRLEQRAKAYKAALFLVLLEDVAGEEKFHRAVRRVLRDMAGQEIGIDVLRSAVEAEAGRDLAGVFHAWLDHAAVPAEFRARYGAR